MGGEQANGRLHLPDLLVTGFRGIERLSIPRLGRVTLLAGRNGAGKTTVLDAVRVYASRGRAAVLRELGAAVGAGDLDANAPPALALVGWLRRLFGG